MVTVMAIVMVTVMATVMAIVMVIVMIIFMAISLIHPRTYTHTPQTSDLPIAEAMIANRYVRHSNLCWDYIIEQLARLMN